MNDMPRRTAYLLVAIATFAFACIAQADPPARVARLSYTSGAISFAPAGDDEWVEARLNRPLVNGDRLWADDGARGEVQLGGAALRFAPLTSLTILNVDDGVAQFQLAQGALEVDVRRLGRDETFEIDTPNLAFSIVQPGRYRIDVDERGDTTAVAVRSGRADVFGDSVAYTIDGGQFYRFSGSRLAVIDSGAVPASDSFDAWAYAREQRLTRAAATRYVSPDMIGYEDLDEFGTWRTVATYGNVWVPRNVPAGWAPYRYGHWAWIEPWGWTWVDDAPWGFAPFHYGRWALIQSRWCWVPGPLNVRPVYAPALVAFVGGPNFQLSVALGGAMSGVAWFPLAPGEVYRPAYTVSREYFTNVNVSNTRINTTYVTNIYNNPANVTQINYINREAPAAVTAVPATVFTQSQPVARAAVQVNRETIVKAPVVETAPIAPTRTSIAGAARPAASRPGAAVLARPAIAKAEPPAPPPPFAARQATLQTNAGKPPPAEETAKSSPRRERPQVRVVAPAPSAATAPPPQAAGSEQPRRGPGAAPPDRNQRATAPPPTAERTPAPRTPAPEAARQRPASPDVSSRAPETVRERPAPPETASRAPDATRERRAPAATAERTRPPEEKAERMRPPEANAEVPRARAQGAREGRPPATAGTTRPAPRQADAAKEEAHAAPQVATKPPPKGPERRAPPAKGKQDEEDNDKPKKEKG